MKIMNCPLNGPRNISEFICGGELRETPDPKIGSDGAWVDYLFMQNNTAGVIYEWWCHVPTSYWFIVRRDTRSEEILETMSMADFSATVGAGDASDQS